LGRLPDLRRGDFADPMTSEERGEEERGKEERGKEDKCRLTDSLGAS